MSNILVYPNDTAKMLDPSIANVHTIAGVLGGSLDVGCLCAEKRYNGSAFVEMKRINPWSFEKPVRLNKIGMLTAEDYAAANYGWEIPQYTTIAQMLYAVAQGERWGYLSPRGMASSEPLRIDDFRSYYHAAPRPPLDIVYPGDKKYIEITTNDDVLLNVHGKHLLNPGTGQIGIWAWAKFLGIDATANPVNYGIGFYVAYANVGPNDPFPFANPSATGIKWCMAVGNPNQGGIPTMSNVGDAATYDLKIPKAYLSVANGFADGPHFLVPFITTVIEPDLIATQEKVDGAGLFIPLCCDPLRIRFNYEASNEPVDNVQISYPVIYGRIVGTYNQHVEFETGTEYGSASMVISNTKNVSMTGAKATLVVGGGEDIVYASTTETIPANGSATYKFNFKEYADFPTVINTAAPVKVHLEWSNNERTYALDNLNMLLQQSPNAV